MSKNSHDNNKNNVRIHEDAKEFSKLSFKKYKKKYKKERKLKRNKAQQAKKSLGPCSWIGAPHGQTRNADRL